MVVKKQSDIDHIQVRVTYGDETLTPETLMDGFVQTTRLKSVVGNLTTDTKSPTLNDSTDCNAFTTPSNAHASDNAYATGVGDVATFTTMYKGFGFAIPAGKKVTKVELLIESKANIEGITHTITIGTPGTPDTCGNFTSYPEGVAVGEVGPSGPAGFPELVRVFDVTNTGHAFIPSDFDDANLRFKLEAFHGVV